MASVDDQIVGTLTFHQARSYGALLQAYALQQLIRQQGLRTEIVDYTCPAIPPVPSYERERSVVNALKSRLHRPLDAKLDSAFDAFREKWLAIGPPANEMSPSDLAKRYSRIIVGSDQVWNPKITNRDDAYLLDFVPNEVERVSYGASLGAIPWTSDIENKWAALLRKFSHVSVREESAKEYLARVFDIQATVVLDPTLMLSAENWRSIKQHIACPEHFVLYFALGPWDKSVADFSRELANRLGADLVVVSKSAKKVSGAINVRSIGPDELLSLFDSSTAVVTESFHGICFSMLFNKRLHWVNSERLSNRSSRIVDLFKTLGVDNDSVKLDTAVNGIDFKRVNTALERARHASFSFLQSSLSVNA